MYTHCIRCSRALKNPVNQERGMGDVCAAKSGLNKPEPEQEEYGSLVADLLPSPAQCGKIIMQRDSKGSAMVNIPHIHVKHSPTGFEWGYGGSGPADLARNILIQVTGSDHGYQDFKFEVIGAIPRDGGEILVSDIRKWREGHPVQELKDASSREYTLQMSENGETINTDVKLESIISPDPENDTECIYALNDRLDKVLDLKVGEAMYFRPIRDNAKTKGIITRIQ